MTFGRAAALAAAALALGACSSSNYVLPTTGGHNAGSTTGSANNSTTGGDSTTGGGSDSTGGTTSSSTDSSTSGSTGGSSIGTTSGGTTGAAPSNACATGASTSLPLGGSCDVNGGPGTCVGEGFYCLIDGDAGLCTSAGYVSGYPFAAVLDGGEDGGPLGTKELFDADAGQPIFNGLCAPTPGALPLGATCTTDGTDGLFGGCIAGAFCIGTCEAACDVRNPRSCGEPSTGQTCRSTEAVGYVAVLAAPQYPQGVCGGCQPPGYGCALLSECCQPGVSIICRGARTSPLLDGGFAYGTCGACTACEGDPNNCPCTVTSDCCNPDDACIGGTCAACIVSGASGPAGTCASSTECCYPGPGGTACIDGSCQACVSSGGTCQIDDDCCSGLCDELALVCN